MRQKYNPKIAIQICTEIATSAKSLKTICAKFNISNQTLFRWIAEREDFRKLYDEAKYAQADFLAEEMLEIADDATRDTIITEEGAMIENKEWTNRSKLRVDARKWIASKLKPKKYGDKIEHSGEVGIKQITGMEIK